MGPVGRKSATLERQEIDGMDWSGYDALNAHAPRGDAPRAAHAADGLAFLAHSTASEAATLDALQRLVQMQRQLAVPAREQARRAARPAKHSTHPTQSTHTVHADEAARHRLARELHDSVGAELAATRFALANVHTWLPENAPPQCAEALALVARSLDAATGAMRHVLDGLHAPQLDAGLPVALSGWVRGFAARTGLAARMTSASDDARLARLPADAALAVFRVAQEALVNVARHAQATRAEVRLQSTPRHLTLTVADDGIGLALARNAGRKRGAPDQGGGSAQTRRGHYGLAGMRERCAAFGGSLRAAKGGIGDEHAHAGTTVRARFAWDALLGAAPPASPLIPKEGAQP
jgi:signal transduction histidine kinase